MEVHHHPDLKHEKKKFREYILEFIMIFLAITMGFFAENLREHFYEKHKEVVFAKSLLHDMKADTAEIRDVMRFNKRLSMGLDSLSAAIFANPSSPNVKEIYRMNVAYVRYAYVAFSDQATTQLKAGGLSLFREPELADTIAEYWKGARALDDVANNYHGKIANAVEIGYTIFNRKYYRVLRADSIVIDPSARFITADSNLLINYANHLSGASSILKNFFKADLKTQLEQANSLIALIKKEYDLD